MTPTLVLPHQTRTDVNELRGFLHRLIDKTSRESLVTLLHQGWDTDVPLPADVVAPSKPVQPSPDVSAPREVEGSAFILRDSAGRVRARFGLSDDGSPSLVMSDTEGRPRVEVGLVDADEQPRMAMFDEAGKLRVFVGLGEWYGLSDEDCTGRAVVATYGGRTGMAKLETNQGGHSLLEVCDNGREKGETVALTLRPAAHLGGKIDAAVLLCEFAGDNYHHTGSLRFRFDDNGMEFGVCPNVGYDNSVWSVPVNDDHVEAETELAATPAEGGAA